MPASNGVTQMNAKKTASICLACSSAVGSTVVTMLIPSLDRSIGIPILIFCGIGFLVSGAIWIWPRRLKQVLVSAVAAGLLVLVIAGSVSVLQSKAVQDYMLDRQFTEKASATRIPILSGPPEIEHAAWTSDASAVCTFRVTPLYGFVHELIETRCAKRNGAGFEVVAVGFPNDDCQIRTRVTPGIVLDSGDLVMVCHNSGDVFATNLRAGGGWRRLVSGFANPYFVDLEGSAQAVRITTRERSVMITPRNDGPAVVPLCSGPPAECPARLAGLSGIAWDSVQRGKVFGSDYRERPYRFEVDLATGRRRENVAREPGIRFFDRETAHGMYNRFDRSVWHGRSGGMPAVAIAEPESNFRLVRLAIPADAGLDVNTGGTGTVRGDPVSDDGCTILISFSIGNRLYGLPARFFVGLFDARTGDLLNLVYSGDRASSLATQVATSVLVISSAGVELVSTGRRQSCLRPASEA
ncbi:MAG TPA: hypothetical protein VMS43_10190 [Allosphingosinicella sp.]|nr:hypothetical protein [Allosphingosinicella sp.]